MEKINKILSFFKKLANAIIENKYVKKIIVFFKSIKASTLKEIQYALFLLVPFLLMETFIGVLSADVNYFQNRLFISNIAFAIIWSGLIVAISRNLKGSTGRIFYAVCFTLFYIMFLTHYIYYPYTGFFFSFNLLESASEGKAYILDTITSISFFSFFVCVLTLMSGVYAIIKFPKATSNHIKRIIVALATFVILHSATPSLLGSRNSTLQWDTWRNPRNVYESFNDGNKTIRICGLCEYSCRDLYFTFLKSDEPDNPEELKFLENTYSEHTPHQENKYTGIFEGKNVIFIQLEGLDSWLLNKEDTPTLYSMQKNSIVFKNHYSYYTGGGSTFNSELAVSTGFLTPVSFTRNAYSFNKNSFPYSLPKMLKNKGYSVNAFHMNNGEFYMRDVNYRNWGYENYYSLMDTKNYSDASYQLDRELIENEFFYEKMFKQKEPFCHYLITYTPHTPFTLGTSVGKLYAKMIYGDEANVPELTEEEVARLYASETDYMMSLLLKALEDNNLIDNTIIVAYADHYLYTLKDKTILDKYKTTTDNRINQTPFFIWSKGLKKTTITKANSQLDILPTVLNLLGVDYCNESYVGRDILDELYGGYAFFSDYSWYDGVNYIQYSDTIGEKVVNKEYIDKTNDTINNRIKKNDLTLKYDYFSRMEEHK